MYKHKLNYGMYYTEERIRGKGFHITIYSSKDAKLVDCCLTHVDHVGELLEDWRNIREDSPLVNLDHDINDSVVKAMAYICKAYDIVPIKILK